MPRIPDSVRRSRNAAGARHQSGPPGASEPLPLGVAGGHQLRRLDDLGTMTAGHQLLHLDDLHTSSFARTESRRRPFRESYGLPSHPSTGNSQRFMISIHALLTENALADEFVSAFHARRLPEKFFYWFPLSVRAWLALRERGVRVSYVPVDTSQALLEMACAGALSAGLPAQGIKADFTNPTHLQALAAEPETPPRLVMLIGNTLGAFDPIVEARDLARLLRPGDTLLVDGEIYAGDATVAGYDNPLNRRFAWAPLNAVGIRDTDGELVFEAADDPRLPGLHLIPKHFLAGRDVEALLGGEALRLARGERLAMNHSYKYAADTFLRILSDAGLAARWQGRSDDQRFLMVLVSPA